MATTISNVGTTFIRYLPGVIETLNQKSKARALVKKDDKWTGAYSEGRLHLERNSAVGNFEDGGSWKPAGNETFTSWQFYRKFTTASVEITYGAQATASGTENNAEDVVTGRIKRAMENVLKFENGMFYRNGDGSVATVQTGTSGTTLLVDDARMLWEGATFEVYDSTLTTNRGTCTVGSVASAPTAAGFATVTVDATLPSGTTATDKIVWYQNVNKAVTGLSKLVDDATGTFQGVNVSNAPRYTSFVLDNSGTKRDLEPTLFRKMLAGIYQKAGSDAPSDGLTVLCSPWQMINFEEIFEGDVRLTPREKMMGISATSFQTSFGRVDLMPETDALYNTMFFADFSQIYRATQRKLDWVRAPGGGIFHPSLTAAVMVAHLLEISELYIKDRRTSGKIEDLNETQSTMF